MLTNTEFFASCTVLAIVAILGVVVYRVSNKKSDVALEVEATCRPFPPKQMWQRIEELNLDSVEQRLRKTRPTWDDSRVVNAIAEYRKFLYLIGTSTEDDIVVPWDDDVILAQQAHILSTEKYASDCYFLFREIVTISNGPDAYTAKARANAFSIPTNTPPMILREYQSSGSGIPWYVWWLLFSNNNPSQASAVRYNPTGHSMELVTDRSEWRNNDGTPQFSAGLVDHSGQDETPAQGFDNNDVVTSPGSAQTCLASDYVVSSQDDEPAVDGGKGNTDGGSDNTGGGDAGGDGGGGGE